MKQKKPFSAPVLTQAATLAELTLEAPLVSGQPA
jgi:hypothetical protein